MRKSGFSSAKKRVLLSRGQVRSFDAALKLDIEKLPKLSVETFPEDATIIIDGQRVLENRKVFPISSKKIVRIVVKRSGYIDFQTDYQVESDEINFLTVSLKKVGQK